MLQARLVGTWQEQVAGAPFSCYYRFGILECSYYYYLLVIVTTGASYILLSLVL